MHEQARKEMAPGYQGSEFHCPRLESRSEIRAACVSRFRPGFARDFGVTCGQVPSSDRDRVTLMDC